MTPEASARERARTGVLNVLMVAGAGIAVSGLVLGRRTAPPGSIAPGRARPWAYAALLALVVVSHLARRLGPSDATGPGFGRARIASAALGALAVPLGFAYGLLVEPTLPAVAPFWVAALALGFLAIPRTAAERL